MKYICFKTETKIEEIITFPRTINHDDISFRCTHIGYVMREPISAGFVSTEGDCYGKSITLNMKSRPEDTEILKKQLIGE